eukprot:Skav227064  [mRNA]  locus=scaffold72:995134:995928:- [translate_table: standard]
MSSSALKSLRRQKLLSMTTPIPDPPLPGHPSDPWSVHSKQHPGTCELVPFLPTLLLTSSACGLPVVAEKRRSTVSPRPRLGPGAVLLFFFARAFSSLLGLLAGALAAASACGLGGIGLFMAGATAGVVETWWFRSSG